MLVSIIIPYYKDKKNIFYSVKSAINQSYRNTEVLIIDDENSDESKKNLSTIKKKVIRLKLFQLKKP